MLGERIAPCWCYSPIHFEWRRTRVQGDALVRQSVTLNMPCDVDRRIYFCNVSIIKCMGVVLIPGCILISL